MSMTAEVYVLETSNFKHMHLCTVHAHIDSMDVVLGILHVAVILALFCHIFIMKS